MKTLLLAALTAPLAAVASTDQKARELRFDVLLGDSQIGEHRFLVSHLPGDVVTVESDAKFTVRVLSVPVFRYRHSARERWSEQCLTRIESNTKANRTRYAVTGELANERSSANDDSTFILERSRDDTREEETMAACLGSFAYWDIERLRRAKLLNPQTGKVEAVELVEMPPAPLPKLEQADEDAPAYTHYELRTGVETIRLWYNAHGEWLALQTEQKGRDLTYQRVNMPEHDSNHDTEQPETVAQSDSLASNSPLTRR